MCVIVDGEHAKLDLDGGVAPDECYGIVILEPQCCIVCLALATGEDSGHNTIEAVRDFVEMLL